MRSLVLVAVLAGLFPPFLGFGGSAAAADLDPYYEPGPPPPVEVVPPPPPPVAILPPPQVPVVVGPRPCGIYRDCPGPYVRFFRRPEYAYERPAYAPIHREGYGYDYDRERFERAHEHFSRYGYDRASRDRYERRDYERRERVERYDRGRPYADPLGHGDRGWHRGERFGDGEERYERGPSPYDRG